VSLPQNKGISLRMQAGGLQEGAKKIISSNLI